MIFRILPSRKYNLKVNVGAFAAKMIKIFKIKLQKKEVYQVIYRDLTSPKPLFFTVHYSSSGQLFFILQFFIPLCEFFDMCSFIFSSSFIIVKWTNFNIWFLYFIPFLLPLDYYETLNSDWLLEPLSMTQ